MMLPLDVDVLPVPLEVLAAPVPLEVLAVLLLKVLWRRLRCRSR